MFEGRPFLFRDPRLAQGLGVFRFDGKAGWVEAVGTPFTGGEIAFSLRQFRCLSTGLAWAGSEETSQARAHTCALGDRYLETVVAGPPSCERVQGGGGYRSAPDTAVLQYEMVPFYYRRRVEAFVDCFRKKMEHGSTSATDEELIPRYRRIERRWVKSPLGAASQERCAVAPCRRRGMYWNDMGEAPEERRRAA